MLCASAAYQLALLTQIPPHAALNETVELAAAFGRPHAKGFLNGVLRRCAPLVTSDRVDAPGADALPTGGRRLSATDAAVLPEPGAAAGRVPVARLRPAAVAGAAVVGSLRRQRSAIGSASGSPARPR